MGIHNNFGHNAQGVHTTVGLCNPFHAKHLVALLGDLLHTVRMGERNTANCNPRTTTSYNTSRDAAKTARPALTHASRAIYRGRRSPNSQVLVSLASLANFALHEVVRPGLAEFGIQYLRSAALGAELAELAIDRAPNARLKVSSCCAPIPMRRHNKSTCDISSCNTHFMQCPTLRNPASSPQHARQPQASTRSGLGVRETRNSQRSPCLARHRARRARNSAPRSIEASCFPCGACKSRARVGISTSYLQARFPPIQLQRPMVSPTSTERANLSAPSHKPTCRVPRVGAPSTPWDGASEPRGLEACLMACASRARGAGLGLIRAHAPSNMGEREKARAATIRVAYNGELNVLGPNGGRRPREATATQDSVPRQTSPEVLIVERRISHLQVHKDASNENSNSCCFVLMCVKLSSASASRRGSRLASSRATPTCHPTALASALEDATGKNGHRLAA